MPLLARLIDGVVGVSKGNKVGGGCAKAKRRKVVYICRILRENSVGRRVGRSRRNTRRRTDSFIKSERAMCVARMYFSPSPKST